MLKHKYPVSVLCDALEMNRSSYYYKPKPLRAEEIELEIKVKKIFDESKNIYGARKIRAELNKENIQVSRRKVRKIMKKLNLVSVYTEPIPNRTQTSKNKQNIENKVNREFSNRKSLEVVVSDLTYVRVNRRWAYVCLMTDLYNRELIGHSCGRLKDAKLVNDAINSIKYTLNEIQFFHTDRGTEFYNSVIDRFIENNSIIRSLSRAGNPHDNAVAESVFKSVKKEFIYREDFKDLRDLKDKLDDYVEWWNAERLHGTLNYMTPIEFRRLNCILN